MSDLFQAWLYTKGKPSVSPNGPAGQAFTARSATGVFVQPKSYQEIKATN